MTKFQINGREVELTTNHAASSYGQPIAIVGGEAFGPADDLPVFDPDPVMDYFHEPAAQTISCALRGTELENDEMVKMFCAR